jgi:hypothetical protein
MTYPKGPGREANLQQAQGWDLEVFDERPWTPATGGDPGNWPARYVLRVANVNGGDSLVVEVDGEEVNRA